MTREEYNAYQKAWYHAHPEKTKAWKKAWNAKNPDRNRGTLEQRKAHEKRYRTSTNGKLKCQQRKQRYRATPRAKVVESLNGAKTRCRRDPKYTLKGIKYLLDDCREEAIAKLLPKYIEMVNAGIKPSIDRIDSDGHYSLENIQALPFNENSAKHS